MPRYRVIITRAVTESTVIQVEAETPAQAKTAAFDTLREAVYSEWELDEGSWNKGDSYVTGVAELPC